jgi:hypothetical protein
MTSGWVEVEAKKRGRAAGRSRSGRTEDPREERLVGAQRVKVWRLKGIGIVDGHLVCHKAAI